jgi:hypothetical protein
MVFERGRRKERIEILAMAIKFAAFQYIIALIRGRLHLEE